VSPQPEPRSYKSTAFAGGVAALLGSVALLVTATDPTVRIIGAVGIVALPALFMITNALVKRAALRAATPGGGGGGLASLVGPLLGALPALAGPKPEVPELKPCAKCGTKGVLGDLNKPETVKTCPDCAGTGLAQVK